MEITLTAKEQERYDIIRACIDGDYTNKETAVRLGLTIRQIQKIKHAVRAQGAYGVRHGLKGSKPSNKTSKKITTQVKMFLKQKDHRDFGPTFAQEQLEKAGIVLSTETVRTIMTNHDLWKVHVRRGPEIHRTWRERMAKSGMLVQFDGSYHDWFENGTKVCLLAAIDDATSNIVRALFEDNEGVFACFRFWKAYVECHGRPVAIYLDKFSTYKINHKNATDNAEMMTQFERAMLALDIRVICANSPEAKGRVERLFGTLQDRMVKEMRLMEVKKPDEANEFLRSDYIPDHNQRFSVEASKPGDAHRPLTDSMRAELSSIFSVHSNRKVNNDFTIQFKTKWFQISAEQKTTVYKRDTVIMEEWLDGSVRIRLKQKYLVYTELPERPKPLSIPVPALTAETPRWIPPANHPWRKKLKN
jgi:transposase-like protein